MLSQVDAQNIFTDNSEANSTKKVVMVADQFYPRQVSFDQVRVGVPKPFSAISIKK